jgi:hypothetical protein
LALALGKTASEIMAMHSLEFTYWIARYSIEPFGHKRDEYHSALNAFSTFRAAGAKQVKVNQFMNDWWNEHKQASDPHAILAYFTQLAKRNQHQAL